MNGNRYEEDEDPRLSEVLGSLPRVPAPRDFDVRLRSRLSRRRPGSVLRRLVPVLAASGLLIFAGGTLLVNRTEGPAPLASAAVADRLPPISAVPSRPVADRTVPVSESPRAARVPGTEKSAVRRDSGRDEPAGSVDLSARTKETRRAGLNGGTVPRGPVTFERPAAIPAAGLLSEIGLETKPENGKLRVLSVRPNSLAERSGVRPEDVVESVDETPIAADTVFTKSAEGKSLTVRREGRIVRLVLRGQ